MIFCDWFLSFNVFKVHPYCCMYQHFIPFYFPMILHCMDIPILPSSSSLVGMWTVSTLKDIMNNAINIHAENFMRSSLLGLNLGIEFLSHMLTLCLTCWEIAKLFLKAVAPSDISTRNAGEFFLHLHQHLLLSIFFYCSHSSGCEVVFYCILIFISLMTNDTIA